MDEILRGAAQVLKAGAATMMWMPGGQHTVTLGAGPSGRPHTITVQVDRNTADVMQKALDARLIASEHKPFFDFAHDEKQAAAWPTRFYWQDGPKPGVYAAVEWSDEGLRAVQGKTYRAFSPAFYASPLNGSPAKPATVTGAPFTMGGLVNDPAFKEISPLWAKAAGASPALTNNKGQNDMEELEMLRAKKKELEDGLTALRGKEGTNLQDIADAEAEILGLSTQIENLELKAKLAKAEEEELARNKLTAKQAVEDAVAAGKLSARDEEGRKQWEETITADPTKVKLLAALKGNPALSLGRITRHQPSAEVAQDDIVTVLRAYGQEKNALEKGMLFKQAISKRLGEVTDNTMGKVLKAANNLGTVAGEIIVQRALELFKNRLSLASRIYTDMTADAVTYNTEINTRIMSVPTPAEYVAGTGYAVGNAVSTDVPVTIDQHFGIPITFNANELAGTMRRLFEEQEEPMHYAIGKQMEDYVLSKILVGTFDTTPIDVLVANFGRDDVIDLGAALDGNGAPDVGRTLLLNTAYYNALKEDTTLTNYGTQQRGEVITGNVLPDVDGFQVHKIRHMPNTATLAGFAMVRSALVLATRLPNDYTTALAGADGGGTVQVITNPDSGFSVQLVQYVDHVKAEATMRLAWMYGADAGNSDGGVLLTDATS